MGTASLKADVSLEFLFLFFCLESKNYCVAQFLKEKFLFFSILLGWVVCCWVRIVAAIVKGNTLLECVVHLFLRASCFLLLLPASLEPKCNVIYVHVCE